MTEKDTNPELLQQLIALKYRVRRPGARTVRGYELYLLDLAEWRLCFSDRTPVIWAKAAIIDGVPAAQLANSLHDLTREQGWRERECLVLLDGDGAALKAETYGRSFPATVIVDQADQHTIISARSPTSALQDVIFEQIPVASLAPYQVGSPVEGSRFFGREWELDRILKQPEANFAVLGIRRIGKTSLLREIRRRLLEQGEPPERVVWLDYSTLSKPEDFVREMVSALHSKELFRLEEQQGYLFRLPNFLKRMYQMHGGRITVILDEADRFLRWFRDLLDVRNVTNYSGDLRIAIRDSVSGGYCRYIVSGFETLMPELFNSASPLYLAFEPVQLGPLTAAETEELVLRPMRSLRVQIEREQDTAARVYADTRGQPLLVQFYCRELVNLVARSGHRSITDEAFDNIYASDTFKTLITNSFRENATRWDKLLVYALLAYYPPQKEAFEQGEMYGALRAKGCSSVPVEEIDRACDRLVLAGTFSREGRKYRFANPAFARVMRAHNNPNYLFEVTKKELKL